MTEQFRPAYHFTPPRMWMNDPNGLVYANGQYHMFYQHHPHATVWGPMHWGHATSRDLVNWQHCPIALAPDEHGTIFSGSAVVDWQNTAGFGAGALVAIFTHDSDAGEWQSLAYSTDDGATWQKYAGNPVLRPAGEWRDFRDPKVFWFEEGGAAHWAMVLAAGTGVRFYTSPNLIDWTPGGSIGYTEGLDIIWETPDLFRLRANDGTARWVLTAGMSRGGPGGGSGTRYFVGEFDGRAFHAETPAEPPLWADFGGDFYAAQSWSDEPQGRRIWVGWMSNLAYSGATPTDGEGWRSVYSVPRVLALAHTPEGLRLRQQPIPELAALRGAAQSWRDARVEPGANLLAGASGRALEIVAALEPGAGCERCGVRVLVGAGGHTEIGYDAQAGELYVDRTRSGQGDFHAIFAARHTAPLALPDGVLRLHILVDHCSVEVFGADGVVVLSEQVFPAPGSAGLELFAEGAAAQLHALDLYELSAAQFLPAPEKSGQ
jgi:fructan beta-fructosidase